MSINNVANEKRADIIDSHYGQNVTDQAARADDVAITKQPIRVLACIRWFAAE